MSGHSDTAPGRDLPEREPGSASLEALADAVAECRRAIETARTIVGGPR